MHFCRPLAVLLIAGLLCPTAPLVAQTADTPAAPAADSTQKFGPYEALVYDATVLSGVKVDEKNNVFLMFRPEHLDTQVTVKISMQNGAAYRKWFTGDEVLVALENTAGRTAGQWADRIQTTANYIEYWTDGKLFLHLKKTDS